MWTVSTTFCFCCKLQYTIIDLLRFVGNFFFFFSNFSYCDKCVQNNFRSCESHLTGVSLAALGVYWKFLCYKANTISYSEHNNNNDILPWFSKYSIHIIVKHYIQQHRIKCTHYSILVVIFFFFFLYYIEYIYIHTHYGRFTI